MGIDPDLTFSVRQADVCITPFATRIGLHKKERMGTACASLVFGSNML
jgi:hypothetical protein